MRKRIQFNKYVDKIIDLTEEHKLGVEYWTEEEHFLIIKSCVKFTHTLDEIQENLLKIQEHPRFDPQHIPFIQYMFALSAKKAFCEN